MSRRKTYTLFAVRYSGQGYTRTKYFYRRADAEAWQPAENQTKWLGIESSVHKAVDAARLAGTAPQDLPQDRAKL